MSWKGLISSPDIISLIITFFSIDERILLKLNPNRIIIPKIDVIHQPVQIYQNIINEYSSTILFYYFVSIPIKHHPKMIIIYSKCTMFVDGSLYFSTKVKIDYV